MERDTSLPFSFIIPGENMLNMPKNITVGEKTYGFDDFLKKNKTVAFLIIRNDTLYYENYFSGYEAEDIVPSFSVAKSFVSALVGIAIDEGHIKSIHEPITNYLEELDTATFGKITIEHLLDMQSGIKNNEGYYNPFGDVAVQYYGTNLRRCVRKLKVQFPPGKWFRYASINTQLLGMIVQNATKTPLDVYLQEKIWKKTGMEYDASWSIDSRKNRMVKAFCCLNARARDFAKFGRLYLHKGNWNGEQLISEKWVNESLSFPKLKNGLIYSYQWWHNVRRYPYEAVQDTISVPHYFVNRRYDGETRKWAFVPGDDFYAHGILGQYVYVYPSKNIIIVRLGKQEGNVDWETFFLDIAVKN